MRQVEGYSTDTLSGIGTKYEQYGAGSKGGVLHIIRVKWLGVSSRSCMSHPDSYPVCILGLN